MNTATSEIRVLPALHLDWVVELISLPLQEVAVELRAIRCSYNSDLSHNSSSLFLNSVRQIHLFRFKKANQSLGYPIGIVFAEGVTGTWNQFRR